MPERGKSAWRRKLEPVMNLPETSPQPSHRRYFFEKFGITERLLERCLGEALSAGGDYADLYFESVTSTSLGVDEQIVKSASTGTSAGCGIRVLSGERTGYAYTDNLNSGQAVARREDRCPDCFGSRKAADSRIHGNQVRRPLSSSARRLRSRPGCAAGADSARRPGGARVRSANRAGARRL